MRVIGTTVGSYRVKQRLGQGGMGSVFRVEHMVLGTMRALKVVSVPSERSRRRLLSEGQIQARLEHENLVAVRDVVDVQGQPGLILDLVRGPTLGRLLAAGPLPIPTIAHLGAGILRGMARAHAEGLVHRDLKPGNVLVQVTADTLVAKVADFGLAREVEGHGLTGSGASLGTPRYMAPEQVRDPRDVDTRTDVWALGAVLYELCCGRPAFERDDDLLVLYGRIAEARYPALAEQRQGLPEAWLDAVEAALQADRTARPADAAALLALWEEGPAGAVDPGVLATAQSLVPDLVDDPVPAETWSGDGTFDSVATGHKAPSPAAVGVATPPEGPEPEPFPEPPAPLPSATRDGRSRRGADERPLLGWVLGGMGFGLVVCIGLGLTVWVMGRPAAPVVLEAPPAPVPVAPVPAVPAVPALPTMDWRGAATAEKARQALLDGDAATAVKQAAEVVVAPVEDPQLVIIAGAAAESRWSSAWEESERGKHFGLEPLQQALSDALGAPDDGDAAVLESGNAPLIYARLRMGVRHDVRDAELLDALAAAAPGRRLTDLARAQVAMHQGDLAAARAALDAALEGEDVPELVRVTDALWYVYDDQLDEAAARIDAVIDGVERPTLLAWVVRNTVDERLGRAVLAAESEKKIRGPVTVKALRRMLRADALLAAGQIEEGLAEARAAEVDLHRYHASKEVNVVRLDMLTERARLGALAGDRASVVDAIGQLKAVAGERLPEARTVAEVRVQLGEVLLAWMDGDDGPMRDMLRDLERRPVGYALERRVLEDVRDGAPLRVHPTQLP